jgi:hypothetical protein
MTAIPDDVVPPEDLPEPGPSAIPALNASYNRPRPEGDEVVPQEDLPEERLAAEPQASDPSEGGSTLKVYNPFGNDLDTHIPTSQTAERTLAGIGKGFSDTAAGVHQIALHIGNHLGLVPDADIQKNQQQIDAAKERDKPLMDTTAGQVGNVIGQAAPAILLPEAGIFGSAAEMAALGAAQPTATSGPSRLENAGMGALGGAGGAAAGKVIKGVLGGFGGAGARQGAVDLLTQEHIPTSVAQKTGAKAALNVERASGITSGEPAEFAAQQGQAFNGAVLRRIGVQDAKNAGPDVLGPAYDRITGDMDAVASRTNVQFDNHLLNDLVSVEDSARSSLPESDAAPIHQNIKNIITNAATNNGSLDSTFLQKMNSNLGALSRNPSTAPVANDLQEVLHDAVQRYANPDDVALLQQARGQYRAMKQIEPAVDPTTGNISVPKLMTSLNSKTYGSRNQTLYGRGDQSLVNLARAAKQVIPDNLGNSGTAERSVPILSAVETLGSGEPLKAGAKLAVGTLGLNAIGKAMRNQGILGKYIAGGLGPQARAVGEAGARVSAPIGYATAESRPRDQSDQQIQRASGGKVDTEVLVNRLINRWKAAKKVTDKTTKPLLGVPDSTIVKALDIAQRAI